MVGVIRVSRRGTRLAPSVSAMCRQKNIVTRRALAALALVSSLTFALSGCATMRRAEHNVLAADPARDAGFLADPGWLAPNVERAPFDRIWISRAPRGWRSFAKLYIAPVDMGHVIETNLWERFNLLRRREVDEVDLPRLASELHDRIEEEFRVDPLQRFEVLSRPDEIDEDTAILEVALVELVPNKAVLGVIGLAAWGAPLEIGIPVAAATSFIAHGSIAMEARVRDGGSGRVVAMFADRETGKARIIDLRSLTWYGNARETLGDWAEALFAVANTPPDEKVRHSPLFTFALW